MLKARNKNQTEINKTREILILILIAFLTYIPFINKAYHIDDPFFLKIVEQILDDYLHPYTVEINWRGTTQNVFEIHTNPPLLQYYLVGIINWFGYSKAKLVLSQSIFLILLCLAIYFLNRRFANRPFTCSVLLICCPAVMVLSHAIFPDLPLLAIYSASIITFIHGVNSNKKKDTLVLLEYLQSLLV